MFFLSKPSSTSNTSACVINIQISCTDLYIDLHVHVRIFHEQITSKVILTKKERHFNFRKIKRHDVSFEHAISTLAVIRSVHSANRDSDEKDYTFQNQYFLLCSEI